LVNVERIKKSNFHCLIAALVEPKNKINYQQKIMKKKAQKKHLAKILFLLISVIKSLTIKTKTIY
jgi:hypothetical protein